MPAALSFGLRCLSQDLIGVDVSGGGDEYPLPYGTRFAAESLQPCKTIALQASRAMAETGRS